MALGRLVGLATSLVLVGACGAARVSKVLDAKATDRQISDHLSSAFGVPQPKVDCPAGVQVKVRKTFDCDTALEGQPLRVHVTLTDDQGHLTVRPAAAVVMVAKIAGAIESAAAKATLQCGPHAVLVERPHTTFDCTATTASGPVTYRVTVQDLAGNVRYEPIAPQAG